MTFFFPVRRHWAWLVLVIGLLHAGAYAWLVPLWQAPDEPGHMEYACLMAALGRPPSAQDESLTLQQQIIASLNEHGFWDQVQEPVPDPLPTTFDQNPFLRRSGRQVGDEPAIYYLLPSLVCRADLPLETQLRLTRLFGALLFGLTGALATWGWQGAAQAGLPGEAKDAASPGADETGDRLFAWLHPLLMMLVPMPAFIAGSANNDSMAMATATAVFAATLRIQRLGLVKTSATGNAGLDWLRLLSLLVLLILALATKKTNAFLLAWLTLLGLGAVWRWIRQGGRRPRVLGLAGLVLCLAVTVGLLLPSGAPSAWRGRGSLPLRAQAPGQPVSQSTPWAAWISDRSNQDFGRIHQSVVGERVLAARGNLVKASVQVRSSGGHIQPGWLTIRDAGGYTETAFEATDSWQTVTLSHTTSLTTTYLKVAVTPGPLDVPAATGSLWVDQFTLATAGGANLLRNGDFDQAARNVELLLVIPLEARWNQFQPQLFGAESYSPAALRRYALFVALMFPGFWGNFGWLQKPLPLWLYVLLAGICLASLAGIVRWLREAATTAPSRGAIPSTAGAFHRKDVVLGWLLAVALIVLQTWLPMIGRDWQPQGRYLFPALLPIVGLLLLGLDRWLRFEHHPRRTAVLLASLVVLDAAGLIWVSRPL